MLSYDRIIYLRCLQIILTRQCLIAPHYSRFAFCLQLMVQFDSTAELKFMNRFGLQALNYCGAHEYFKDNLSI